jgi:site-specific DNA-adenine methylase
MASSTHCYLASYESRYQPRNDFLFLDPPFTYVQDVSEGGDDQVCNDEAVNHVLSFKNLG